MRLSHALLALACVAVPAGGANAQPLQKALEAAGGGGETKDAGVDAAAPQSSVADLEAQLQLDAETWRAKAAEFQKLRDTVPERMDEVEAALEEARSAPKPGVAPGLSAEEIGYELALAEEDLRRLDAEAARLDSEPERRTKRRRELPALITSARERLRELETEIVLDPDSEATPVEQAEELRIQELRRAVLEAEIAAYQAELTSYDARVTLLARQSDLAETRLGNQTALVARLREALAEAQRETVEEDARRARQLLDELDGLPAPVQEAVADLAERNLAFSELWTGENGLVEKITTVSERLVRARQQVSAVRSDLTRLTAKVEAAGLQDSVGAMLRRERSQAPDIGMYKRFVRMRQEQITEAQLQQLRLAEQREAVADVESRVHEALLAMGGQLSAAQREQVEELLRELFDNQRKYMDALVADHEEYFRKLVEFDQEQRQLIDESERLIDFINERVLWVRSGGPMGPELPGDTKDAVTWLVDGRYLKQLGNALRFGFRQHTLPYLLLALGMAAALVWRRRLRQRVKDLARGARDPGTDRFQPTAIALGLSVLGAASFPAIVYGFGRLLEASPAATQYTRAIAHGTWATALFCGSLAIPRMLLMEDGVSQAHCQWPRVACIRLRKKLLWLAALAGSTTFLMFAAESKADDAMRESLGRLAFLATMIATSVFSHLVLRERGAFAEIMRMRRSRRIRLPTRRAIHGALTLLPLALAGAAAFGFYFTALQLAVRLHMTLCMLLGVLLTSDLLHRWAAIAQRNVAEAREAEAREADLTRASSVPSAISSPGADAPHRPSVVTNDILDLTAISEQTRRLTASLLTVGSVVGLGAIWAELLPAAGILRNVELWRVRKEVEPGTAESASAAAAEALGEIQWVPVTLADLAMALLVAAVCIVLLRNLPGLLEVTLFRRLHAGERYAFATILKYAIAVAGVTLAFESIGVSWSSLQWLVAAVGLGLGFGLQEIFANFVSGILILLERPIRVGDLVTVTGVSGTVSRIRIRATTITTFERKELIVPNKEFITSQLVNWSLSDPVLRVTVPVGIAYGSDVQLALEALRRVAEENPRVIREPEPQVLFLGFGDSSLNLELRAFVGEAGQALTAKHELHVAVDQAFREAGIEIPFPQRDLHLKSFPPGQPGGGATSPDAPRAEGEPPAPETTARDAEPA